MSSFSAFKLNCTPIQYAQGGGVIPLAGYLGCLRFMRDVLYVDTNYACQDYRNNGIQIKKEDDLEWYADMVFQPPQDRPVTILAECGIGDLISATQALSKLQIENIYCRLDRGAILPKQWNVRMLPARLADLQGKTIYHFLGIPFSNPSHSICMNQIFADIMGISGPFGPPLIDIPVNAQLRWQKSLQNLKRPLIGLQLMAAVGKRTPPASLLLDAALEIIGATGGTVILLGDILQFNHIKREFINPKYQCGGIISAMGITAGVEDYAAVIAQCDIIITPDTASLHIGGALGKPTIGVTAVYPPAYAGGGYPSYISVEASSPCSPCCQHANGDCTIHVDQYQNPICWATIKPGQISTAAIAALKELGYGNQKESKEARSKTSTKASSGRGRSPHHSRVPGSTKGRNS